MDIQREGVDRIEYIINYLKGTVLVKLNSRKVTTLSHQGFENQRKDLLR